MSVEVDEDKRGEEHALLESVLRREMSHSSQQHETLAYAGVNRSLVCLSVFESLTRP